MRHRQRLVGPSLFALLMFAVLIGLGTWQVRRLHWKQGILAAIASAESAPPVTLHAHPGPFEKIVVSGILQPERYLLYGADVRDTPRGPVMGARLIQPLLRPNALPLLVDRGWVPQAIDVRSATPPGTIDVVGYVRAPETPGPFSPQDDAASHRVYTLNPAAMAAALGLPRVAPFTVIQLGQPAPGLYPDPATTLPRPPNDHLSYAVTWFGLAAVLVGVFALWVRTALQEGGAA